MTFVWKKKKKFWKRQISMWSGPVNQLCFWFGLGCAFFYIKGQQPLFTAWNWDWLFSWLTGRPSSPLDWFELPSSSAFGAVDWRGSCSCFDHFGCLLGFLFFGFDFLLQWFLFTWLLGLFWLYKFAFVKHVWLFSLYHFSRPHWEVIMFWCRGLVVSHMQCQVCLGCGIIDILICYSHLSNETGIYWIDCQVLLFTKVAPSII